ncbi:ribosome recycling factor [Aerococcus kribbianus]|uniref:Ribosome-recycling factor n=1 Tax=Aerococcus kribbianus TaxID=2999064 RepID=A0A9X3FR18_9LACT|nr:MULTISPECIES: ribosome recycling factor [unclassified Aerococcus]MCZ0716762.1 ribosome recycling factor [Aerococcus sp. YH-aer221]MCZ0725050.1 ribosome recycling factor [Aerococcus sp. YH-aer222]
MAIENLLNETKKRMQKSEDSLQRELNRIRAGVANASLLDGINVDYYGAPTPLNQLATISTPEPRMLMITPYDKSSLGEIDKAIQMSDIGIPPTNDGNVIRLTIPALTQERRQELVKLVGRDLEDGKIAVRNIRRDAMDEVKKAEKNNELTKDDVRNYEDDIQKLTDASVKNMETIAENKESEILNV